MFDEDSICNNRQEDKRNGGGVKRDIFFLMIPAPPEFTQGWSSAASDVYKGKTSGRRWKNIFK